jgi:uncharacterized protein YndB with AHSA1/START domain
MSVEPEIHHAFVVKAPREKVWSALTTQAGWAAWFSEDVQGDFQQGSTLLLNFEEYDACSVLVVERDEMNAFAYKWHPGEDCAIDKYPDDQMTLVRFQLADDPDGTLVTLTESGFDRLPDDRRAAALQANIDGWKWELAELRVYLELGVPQVLSLKEIVNERIYHISREVLWELIATPAGMKQWCVKDVSGQFAHGQFATLIFGEKNYTEPLKTLEYDPPSRFTFKWHPGEPQGCTWETYPEEEATQITFTLTEVDGGTHLHILEEGFGNIPYRRRYDALELNVQGWTEVMELIDKAVA